MTTQRACYLCLTCLMLFSSCSDDSVLLDPSSPDLPVQDRGIQFATNVLSTGALWSRSTNEIIFTTQTDSKIIAKNVTTSAERVLEQDLIFYDHLTLSEDGNYLYFLANHPPYPVSDSSPSLFRISLSDAVLDTLVQSLDVYMLGGDPKICCSSSDNTLVAYYLAYYDFIPDSIFVYNSLTKTNYFLTTGSPLVLSPDGSKLFLYRFGGYKLFDLENHSVQSISAQKPHYTGLFSNDIQFPLFKWDSNGLREFFSTDSALWIRDILTGSIDTISVDSVDAFILNYFTYADFTYAGWAQDGHLTALWDRSSCLSFSLFTDPCADVPDKYWLYIADFKSKKVAQAAYLTVPNESPGVGRTVAFSPDAKSFAYTVSGRLYLKDIPP